jgi:hypothetical protein
MAKFPGSRLAAPATAMPIAAVLNSLRRSWLIASVIAVVRIGESPWFNDQSGQYIAVQSKASEAFTGCVSRRQH